MNSATPVSTKVDRLYHCLMCGNIWRELAGYACPYCASEEITEEEDDE